MSIVHFDTFVKFDKMFDLQPSASLALGHDLNTRAQSVSSTTASLDWAVSATAFASVAFKRQLTIRVRTHMAATVEHDPHSPATTRVRCGHAAMSQP